MTKKSNNRFGYLQGTPEAAQEPQEATPSSDTLKTVPKGQGRMEQDRTQLNIRIPTALKRRAAAKAALDGSTLGEVIEQLLQSYIETSES